MKEPMGSPSLYRGFISPATDLQNIRSGMFSGTGLIKDVIEAAFDMEHAAFYTGQSRKKRMEDARLFLWEVTTRLEAYGKEAEANEVKSEESAV